MLDSQQAHASDLAGLEEYAERVGVPVSDSSAFNIFTKPDIGAAGRAQDPRQGAGRGAGRREEAGGEGPLGRCLRGDDVLAVDDAVLGEVHAARCPRRRRSRSCPRSRRGRRCGRCRRRRCRSSSLRPPVMSSLPAPPSTRSIPLSPRSLSLPASPNRSSPPSTPAGGPANSRSAPAPPNRRSSPEPAARRSRPASPRSTSLPESELRRSLPRLPRRVSAAAAAAKGVVAGAAVHPVVAAAAVHAVAVRPAVQAVLAGLAADDVAPAVAPDAVVPAAAEEPVAPPATRDPVLAGAAADHVRAGGAAEPVGALRAVDRLGAGHRRAASRHSAASSASGRSARIARQPIRPAEGACGSCRVTIPNGHDRGYAEAHSRRRAPGRRRAGGLRQPPTAPTRSPSSSVPRGRSCAREEVDVDCPDDVELRGGVSVRLPGRSRRPPGVLVVQPGRGRRPGAMAAQARPGGFRGALAPAQGPLHGAARPAQGSGPQPRGAVAGGVAAGLARGAHAQLGGRHPRAAGTRGGRSCRCPRRAPSPPACRSHAPRGRSRPPPRGAAPTPASAARSSCRGPPRRGRAPTAAAAAGRGAHPARQRQRAEVVRRPGVDTLLGAGGHQPHVAAGRARCQPARQGAHHAHPRGVVVGARAGRGGVGVGHHDPQAAPRRVVDADRVARAPPAGHREALDLGAQPGAGEGAQGDAVGRSLGAARRGTRAQAGDAHRRAMGLVGGRRLRRAVLPGEPEAATSVAAAAASRLSAAAPRARRAR